MKKVLLVDDDPVFTSIVQKAAAEFGLVIETVQSVKKFKACKLDGYDAFLVDYDLNDGTGDQILEILSKNKDSRPVVMISATNQVKDAVPEAELHPFTFVSKWQDTSSFLQNVRKSFDLA